jgi:hypothetical protein
MKMKDLKTPLISGNGQPVIAGTVSSINGSSVVVATTSNVSYTVDVSNAKIVQDGTTIGVSGMKVGDKVVIQGTFNGTTVAATSVIDSAVTMSQNGKVKPKKPFGGIGNFFAGIFGF